ncbi:MAG: hypothetical protein V2A73_04710, partial [Pseudomonadota bacterium]
EQKLARWLQVTQLSTGVLFYVAYAIGVVHAYRHQEPRVVEKRRVRPLSERLFIGPVLGHATVGLSASLEL